MHRLAGVPVRSYSYPGTAEQYYPNPCEPVDRWYQANFSSNASTVQRIVLDVIGCSPASLIDPFCGAGSTAVVARRLGIPFLGIELDPVLAEISRLKSTLSLADISSLEDHVPAVITPDWLCDADPRETPRCAFGFGLAALISGRSRDMMFDLVYADLLRSPGPIDSGAVRCGDSRKPQAWHPSRVREKAVIFTSPPFPAGARASVAEAWAPQEGARVRRKVGSQLSGKAWPESASNQFPPEFVVASALKAGREECGSFMAIIEYQDKSADFKALVRLLEILKDMYGIVIHEVLFTRDFSGLGTLFELVVESLPMAGV